MEETAIESVTQSEEIIIIEESSDPVVETTKAESFCTNWKCVMRPVKLVTLKGDQVLISSLNSDKE